MCCKYCMRVVGTVIVYPEYGFGVGYNHYFPLVEKLLYTAEHFCHDRLRYVSSSGE